eukprot:1150355-Pelagomonas_calceolata.AAC.5
MPSACRSCQVLTGHAKNLGASTSMSDAAMNTCETAEALCLALHQPRVHSHICSGVLIHLRGTLRHDALHSAYFK